MRFAPCSALAPALLAALALSACGDSGGDQSAEAPRTVTVVERVRDVPAEPEATVALRDEPDEEAVSSEEQSPGEIVVPDVVGEDHQLAQDTMQAAGLYMLDEEDATGQGRMLIMDRNWTVVSQSPEAGERVSEGTEILPSSEKDDE